MVPISVNFVKMFSDLEADPVGLTKILNNDVKRCELLTTDPL